MRKLFLIAGFFLGFLSPLCSAARSQSGDAGKVITFPIRSVDLGGINQSLKGNIFYSTNGKTEAKGLTVHIVTSKTHGDCAIFHGCSQSISVEISFETEGEYFLESGNEFYDKDGIYMGSIESDGVICTARSSELLPSRSIIGTFGKSHIEQCENSNVTTSETWSLIEAPHGMAELRKESVQSDGSRTTLTLIINSSGDVFGAKIDVLSRIGETEVRMIAKSS